MHGAAERTMRMTPSWFFNSSSIPIHILLCSLYSCLRLYETEKIPSRDYCLKHLNRNLWFISRKNGCFCPRTSSYFLLTQLHFTWALKRGGSCLILSLPVSSCSEEGCFSQCPLKAQLWTLNTAALMFSFLAIVAVLTAICTALLLPGIGPSLH